MAGTLRGKKPVTGSGWHTPVIQAIQEAEVGDSQVQNQLPGAEEMAPPLKASIVLAEEFRFGSLHLHEGSQPSVPPVQEDLKLSFGLCGHQVHKQCTHMYSGKHPYT